MNSWRVVPYRKYTAFENMAIDEAIFRGQQRGFSPPTLRFYGWQPPAVSLGYFQDGENEVHLAYCRESRIDIVRRPTGGRAVFHDRELTYSLIVREGTGLFSSGILDTYLIIGRCILKGLSMLGVQAEMTPQGRGSPDAGLLIHCFSVPSRYEILVNGKKVCGSAQTRSNGAFLQHGSLLLHFDPLKAVSVIAGSGDRQATFMKESVTALDEHMEGQPEPEEISRVLCRGFADVLGVTFVESGLTEAEELLRDELVKNKYGTDLWNRSGRTLVHND